MKLHKLLCAVLCTVMLLQPITAVAEAVSTKSDESEGDTKLNTTEFYKSLVEKETNYIQKQIQVNGGLPMNPVVVTNSFDSKELPDIDGIPDETYKTWKYGKIMPYFSESAILGILKTSPESSKEVTEKFIGWYFDHLNTSETDLNGVDGTVYDYYIFVNPADKNQIVEITIHDMEKDEHKNPAEIPDYDSTDSYAALFVRVLYEYYKIYGEKDMLISKKAEVDRVLNALFSTYIEKYDLTYAKPSYPVFYLMDNCEVYNGLVAAASLYSEVFGDNAKSIELADYAEKVKAAIEKYMWDEKAEAYYPGLFGDGTSIAGVTAEDLKVFYPNATAQLFPLIFGLLDENADRAIKIYDKFNANFGLNGVAGKDWAVIDKGDDYPWCTIARAATAVGDYKRADMFYKTLFNKFINLGHAYPYYTGEAGQALLGINGMLTPVELLGVESEQLTVKAGENIGLGAIVYPECADAAKLNVKIDDNTIVEFDKKSGQINALKAGKTKITVSLDNSIYYISMTVTGEEESNASAMSGTVSDNKSGGKNNPLYTILIAAGATILSVAVIFSLKPKQDKKQKKTK